MSPQTLLSDILREEIRPPVSRRKQIDIQIQHLLSGNIRFFFRRDAGTAVLRNTAAAAAASAAVGIRSLFTHLRHRRKPDPLRWLTPPEFRLCSSSASSLPPLYSSICSMPFLGIRGHMLIRQRINRFLSDFLRLHQLTLLQNSQVMRYRR